MARLYAYENVPRKVVVAGRQLGHNVLTVFDAGQANRRVRDDAVLAFAVTTGRAVLTINRRDFIQMHRLQPVHHGIIICTEDVDAEE